MRHIPTALVLSAALLLGTSAAPGAADAPPKSPARPQRAPDPSLAPVADVAGLPRVLLIGDSVSIGYTLPVRELLKGKANIHRPPANCSSTGHGLANLASWLGDAKWDVIHFNFGLHDAKLPPEGIRHAPPDVYGKNLRELVQRMKATGAKLIFATTTPVPNGGNLAPDRRFGSVDEYNAVALRVMKDCGVAVDDLHAAIVPHVDRVRKPNDVHFTDEGSALLAGHVAAAVGSALLPSAPGAAGPPAGGRPNILIAIADDQSFEHTSFAGFKAVRTPAFDRVAREGVIFRNGFAASPGCSPSRAALLTGRHAWQIEQAGTHASSFPAKYVVFPDLLERSGYFVGMTGKGWSPGNFKIDGRPRNPAGPAFGKRTAKPPCSGMNHNDYAANFADFLAARPKDAPFCFWYGATEPHRSYEKGSGLTAGKNPADAPPPPFLPDTPEVRSDILDYCVEIEWFDAHLGRMLKQLEDAGELGNTLVIVTADNGMPFPRAKANLYEYGFHVPLAIRWAARAPGGRAVDDPVGFVDLTATILDAAGVKHPGGEFPMSGRSLVGLLASGAQGAVEPDRVAYGSRERHSSSRYNNWTYPQRALRTKDFLYIRNFRPERWPAGDPVVLRENGAPAGPHSGYADIDGGPTRDFLVAKADDPDLGRFLQLAVGRRPAEELFDVRKDPGCLVNLADDAACAATKQALAKQLDDHLRRTGDARVLDGGEVWESYPRYSPMRRFPAPPSGP